MQKSALAAILRNQRRFSWSVNSISGRMHLLHSSSWMESVTKPNLETTSKARTIRPAKVVVRIVGWRVRRIYRRVVAAEIPAVENVEQIHNHCRSNSTRRHLPPKTSRSCCRKYRAPMSGWARGLGRARFLCIIPPTTSTMKCCPWGPRCWRHWPKSGSRPDGAAVRGIKCCDSPQFDRNGPRPMAGRK